jgi:hypothetical protein
MTLTREQYDQLVGAYAEQVVEGMDIKSLEQFAYDTIVENFDDAGDDVLLDQLCAYYEVDEVCDMLESVGANPEDYDITKDDDELTEEQIQFLRDVVKPDNT